MTVNQSKMLIVDADQFMAELIEAIKPLLAEQQAAPPAPDNWPELLTRKQAAQFLQCSLGTIDNLTRAGILEKVFIGAQPRFRRDDLREAAKAYTRTKAA